MVAKDPWCAPTAVLVPKASGALGIIVGLPFSELAEARSTPGATDVLEASIPA